MSSSTEPRFEGIAELLSGDSSVASRCVDVLRHYWEAVFRLILRMAGQTEYYVVAVIVVACFAPVINSLLTRLLGKRRVKKLSQSFEDCVKFAYIVTWHKPLSGLKHWIRLTIQVHQTTWVYIKGMHREHRGGKRHHHRGEHKYHQKFNSGVTLYRKMPLKSMSRLWGKVNDINLPVFMRSPMYKLYTWCFDCNLQEAAVEDLKHYNNLGEFFRRALKPSVRPVDVSQCLVSPSDGKVLHLGTVDRGVVEQVKGVTYSLEAFLGPNTWEETAAASSTSKTRDENFNISNNNATIASSENLKERENVMKPDFMPLKEDYQAELMASADNELYHCIIYLAPGDYHRFHSPADWTVKFRRHFPGELFSVNPGIARWIRGLFNFNERAVYYGRWKHGFMSMAAVGATNVGSIKVYCDGELVTNCGGQWPAGTFFDEPIGRSSVDGIQFGKGENFGEFNLGSTLVMVFEAPKSFKFNIQPGQKVKFGQALGSTEGKKMVTSHKGQA